MVLKVKVAHSVHTYLYLLIICMHKELVLLIHRHQ